MHPVLSGSVETSSLRPLVAYLKPDPSHFLRMPPWGGGCPIFPKVGRQKNYL